MLKYRPGLTLTLKIFTLTAQISEMVGRLSTHTQYLAATRVQHNNKLNCVQGSLALAGKKITLAEINQVLEGRSLVVSLREVKEIQNTLAVYSQLDSYNPTEEQDLLAAHATLMAGLSDKAGCYANSSLVNYNLAEFSLDRFNLHSANSTPQTATHSTTYFTQNSSKHLTKYLIKHLARHQVNQLTEATINLVEPAVLMGNLFAWLETNEYPALITSCIFYYELDLLQPFMEGNGRLARLWYSLILTRWNPIFTHLPIEALLATQQEDYHQAKAKSLYLDDCAPFVELMLTSLATALTQAFPAIAEETSQLRAHSAIKRGKKLDKEAVSGVNSNENQDLTQQLNKATNTNLGKVEQARMDTVLGNNKEGVLGKGGSVNLGNGLGIQSGLELGNFADNRANSKLGNAAAKVTNSLLGKGLGVKFGNELDSELGKNKQGAIQIQQLANQELTANQQGLLKLLLADPKITLVNLAKQLNLSTTAIENNLKKLREKKLVERKGGRRTGYWQVNLLAD